MIDDREYCIEIDDRKHNTLDGSNDLQRDYSVQSRARFRLTCRRGDWWADPGIGSQLHKVNTLGQARRQAQQFCEEALQDLIDDGDILAVTVVDIEEDPVMGYLAASVQIDLPDGDLVDIGLIPVGA